MESRRGYDKPVDCANSSSELSVSCGNTSSQDSTESSITGNSPGLSVSCGNTSSQDSTESSITGNSPGLSVSCGNTSSQTSDSGVYTSDDAYAYITDQTGHRHCEAFDSRTNFQPEIAAREGSKSMLDMQALLIGAVLRPFTESPSSSTSSNFSVTSGYEVDPSSSSRSTITNSSDLTHREIDSPPSRSISRSSSGLYGHETPDPWGHNGTKPRVIFRPHDVVPLKRVFNVENGYESSFSQPGNGHPTYMREEILLNDNGPYSSFQNIYQTPTFEETDRGRLCLCKCRTKYIPIVCTFFILLVTFGVTLPFIINGTEEAACQFLPNQIICPFKPEYSRINILSPPVHLENGGGRISYELKDGTDVTIHGFNIHVKNDEISVRKQPSDCPEVGEYPIKFTNGNINSTELHKSKLFLRMEDWSNELKMEITSFTNISDNKDYVQVVCTGYHRCGTVVVDLELKMTDFGTYYKPMECSRTNADGEVFDNYGYSCILFMGVDMFQRTDNLKCKPMVESLENATTKYLPQQSVDVYNSTKVHFRLKKGQNATIKWNVNVSRLKDIRHLQKKFSGVFHPNTTHARLQLFFGIRGHVTTCEVRFHPVTCIDNGTWELQLHNGHTQQKVILVDGMSTFTGCLKQITVPVGGRLNQTCRYCIPDGLNTCSLDLYGRTNRSGSIQEDKAIEIDYPQTYFLGILHQNELSVTFRMQQVTCHDHMKNFSLAVGTNGGTGSELFRSLAKVTGRYESFSTGGDFRENFPAVVNLRITLGCRPQKLEIGVNGSLLADKYNITEDKSTGEKMFSKSFYFPKLTMLDDGTNVTLRSSFIDDEGSQRNINITQVIRVVPDTFCQGKLYGCNYHHPHNANMMVACGEGLIAGFRKCQPGLVFFNSSCFGECCQEGSTTNCQRP